MKWRVPGQEVDQRKLGERLWKKTNRHICIEEVRQVVVPYQLDVRQLQCLVEFVAMRHRDKVCYLRLTC